MNIQVSILKESQVTNQASFESQELAEAWVAYHEFSGEIVYEDISAKLEQEAINAASLKLLSDTDWMVLRELDSGVPCPIEIKQSRAEARAKIVK